MRKYILFDLDGTLTDSMPGICKSAAKGLAHFGIERDYRSLKFFVGPPLMDSFMQCGLTAAQAKEAIRVYREYYAPTGIFENELYTGVKELLLELKSEGRVIALATSKPERFAMQILEHFGIAQYFDFIAGATMDESRTSKSAVLSYVLDRMKLSDMSQAVMIGDRCYDVIGARAVGIECIGVLYGYGSKSELEDAGAVRTAGSVAELKAILDVI